MPSQRCGSDEDFCEIAKSFARPSSVGACTYVENVAGQVRPMVRERLPAAVLTIWSLRDGVCWPRWQPKETTRESSCWLCRGDNCRCGAHRLVGPATVGAELVLGLPRHETYRSFNPRSPRRRSTRPRCRPRLACSASPSGSSCGPERCPRSAHLDRCGTCWSCSDARSLRRSCCSAHTRDFALPTSSSA